MASLWHEGHLDRDARREASPVTAEAEGGAMHLQAKEAGGRQKLGEARRDPPGAFGDGTAVSMADFGPQGL